MTEETTSAVPTVHFTEEMSGHVSLGEAADFNRGAEEGKKSGTDLMFHLTITVHDVDRFVADRAHEATTEGYVQCDALGGKLPVSSGLFNCLVDKESPAHKEMLYRLYFKDGAGQPLTLSGFKTVRDDPGFDLWTDTTTLYTKVFRGHVAAPDPPGVEVVATGILRLDLADFIKQLTTFRATGPTSAERASALGKFAKLFLGQLWEVYGKHIQIPSSD